MIANQTIPVLRKMIVKFSIWKIWNMPVMILAVRVLIQIRSIWGLTKIFHMAVYIVVTF